MITDLESYYPAIIQVQDCAQVHLMDFDAYIIFKLRHIRQPFFIRCFCMEITVQIVLCDVIWISVSSCTALRFPFNSRLDSLSTADAQDTLVIHVNVVFHIQLVSDSAIPPIGMLFMDLLYFFCYMLILKFAMTFRLFQPSVIS